MNFLDQDGRYVFKEGTRTLDDSDHPVFNARIEIDLPLGEWLYAPNNGHGLNRFKTAKQSESNVDEFKKGLRLYLKKYSPELISIISSRVGVELELAIDDEVLNT